MLLTIDIGNSNIVAAIFNEGQIITQSRTETRQLKVNDGFDVFNLDVSDEEITNVIIASVVPSASKLVENIIAQDLQLKPILIGENLDNLGIEIKTDNKYEVGEDRLVNSVAAFEKYHKATIVIDFGTATTFDVVDEKGNYLGGVIAPGINLSIDTLSHATAKLPKINFKKPQKVIGTNTIAAIEAGMFHGYLGLINGLVVNIKKEYGKEMITIATGGLSAMFAADSEVIDFVDSDLTVKGLQIIHNKIIKNNVFKYKKT